MHRDILLYIWRNCSSFGTISLPVVVHGIIVVSRLMREKWNQRKYLFFFSTDSIIASGSFFTSHLPKLVFSFNWIFILTLFYLFDAFGVRSTVVAIALLSFFIVWILHFYCNKLHWAEKKKSWQWKFKQMTFEFIQNVTGIVLCMTWWEFFLLFFSFNMQMCKCYTIDKRYVLKMYTMYKSGNNIKTSEKTYHTKNKRVLGKSSKKLHKLYKYYGRFTDLPLILPSVGNELNISTKNKINCIKIKKNR